jgi:hypothetical protein
MRPIVRHQKCLSRVRAGVGLSTFLGLTLAAVLTPSMPAPVTAAGTIPDSPKSAYVPVGPLRLADTREPECGCVVENASTLTVDVTGRFGIPENATAASLTITGIAKTVAGFVTAYPSGSERPSSSTLNTRRDRVVANSAIIPIGDDGAITLFRLFPTEIIIDVTGYFVPADAATAGRFVANGPRRVVDSRQPGEHQGKLGNNGQITIPLPDGVDFDATALVVNVTSLLQNGPGHLRARPAGSADATGSFLNYNGFVGATAAASIQPVSAQGFTITSQRGGHIIVDVLGWFTGPSSAETDVGLFVPVEPVRLHDTRKQRPRIWPNGTIEITNPASLAGSLVTNVTVTESDRPGVVTAYPAGTIRPPTSTVNPAFHNHSIANQAITRVSDRGIAYYALAGADLVVDLTGYFIGTPVTATHAPPPNVPGHSRVLMVGDSTLAALDVYTDARAALQGFTPIIDAESCRRLLRPSCRSDVTHRIPSTAVEAILGTPGRIDILVMKAGYNDWFSDFPKEFDAVVRAGRSKGAHTVIWLSYNEDVARADARRAYRENNEDLFVLTSQPQYADVHLADWLRYSRADWFADGTHMNRTGSYAVSDYISRWVAYIEHKPCTRPLVLGGVTPNPCPKPDHHGAVADVRSLY